MQFTLKDIADFCFTARRKLGFKDFTKTQVSETIVWAAKNDKLVFVTDEEGICGVGIFTAVAGIKTIYVHHIVAIRHGFDVLVDFAERTFPGFCITGSRRGKMKVFNLT